MAETEFDRHWALTFVGVTVCFWALTFVRVMVVRVVQGIQGIAEIK